MIRSSVCFGTGSEKKRSAPSSKASCSVSTPYSGAMTIVVTVRLNARRERRCLASKVLPLSACMIARSNALRFNADSASEGERLLTFRICGAVMTSRKLSEMDSLFWMNKMWVTGARMRVLYIKLYIFCWNSCCAATENR